MMYTALLYFVVTVGFSLTESGLADTASCRGILMNAEPFGFGPASAIAQVHPHIAPYADKIGYIGEGHTLDLQASLSYDEIVALNSGASDEDVRRHMQRLFKHYSHFLTASDFRYADLALEVGFRVAIYDPLTWYWPAIPDVVGKVDLYAAQDFVGVQQRITSERSSFPKATTVVSPIAQFMAKPLTTQKKPFALINLGGLSNPYATHELLTNFAKAVIEASYKAVSSSFEDVVVTTNGKIVAALPSSLKATTFTPAEIQEHIGDAGITLMTSGLGNLFEASAARAHTIWLPPANDSQGQQISLLRKAGMVDWAIDWHEFTDALEIDYFQDQHVVIAEINRRMTMLVDTPEFQDRLASLVLKLLRQAHAHRLDPRAKPLKLSKLVARYGQNGIGELGRTIRLWLGAENEE